MPKPKVIGIRIDIETRSRIDIKHGVYRYCEDPDFKVLVISYCPIRRYPGGAEKLGRIRRVDPDNPDPKFVRALHNRRFQKHAFNAAFERVALSKWLGMPNGEYLDPENWWCSAVRANIAGVFGSLDEVGRAVRSPVKKDKEGKRLIRLFSSPDSKTDQFTEPEDAPQDFVAFGDYCDNDVLTEAMVAANLPPVSPVTQAEYEADQRINDRGIRHFKGLSEAAVAQVQTEKDRLMGELQKLTGLDNPNSGKQMQGWLNEQGYPMPSLDKDHRADALDDPMVPEVVAEALELKGRASLSSVQKHKAALGMRCGDGRVRGALRFYGAHTGREAGRGIQPQNLPSYEAPAKDRHRLLRDAAGQDAPTIAKGTVRSSLVPAKGHVFVVCDYNAIEARVLAGLAGETWAENEFRGEGKIYEATAEQMFPGVSKRHLVDTLEHCDKCGVCPECVTRNQGKVSNLSLGYGGGAGALVTMGAEDAGIDCGNYKSLHAEWTAAGKPGKFHEWEQDRHDYPELLRLRDKYRDASPMTVRFWKLLAKAWDVSARTGQGAKFGQHECLTMIRDGKHNRLILPSGRSIWYRFARSHEDPNQPERIDRRTFIGKGKGVGHVRTETHGGKLCENVVQAVARDVLFDLIMRIEAKTAQGWAGRIVFHVHDEVVLEVPRQHAQQVSDDVIAMMGQSPAWANFLLVKGEGGIMERYAK